MKNVARYEYESKCVTELIKRNILVIKTDDCLLWNIVKWRIGKSSDGIVTLLMN